MFQTTIYGQAHQLSSGGGQPVGDQKRDYLVFAGKLDIWAVQFNAEAYKPTAVWPD